MTILNPAIDEQLVIEVEPIASIRDCADAVIAIDGRNEFAGPANGEIFRRDAGSWRNVVGGKVDRGIDAG